MEISIAVDKAIEMIREIIEGSKKLVVRGGSSITKLSNRLSKRFHGEQIAIVGPPGSGKTTLRSSFKSS